MSEAVGTVNKKRRGGIGKFVTETREEVKKVSFPSREDVQNTTLIVIANVIFFALFLFLVDQAWVYIIFGLEWVIGKIAGL
ncbi:MAG TPA: preprotein translocase subunit SecE [Pyrinomonadaceae bacterium]|nr:preprotein translocase subunit SecE [Pyrinomonadaceae bacterium]